jgi:hypothetical protein
LTARSELLVARRRDDRARAERSCDLEGCECDAAADAPDENPLVLFQGRLRNEHAVRGLEGERERSCLLERERVVERIQLGSRNSLELAVRAVGVLADHRDPPVVRDAWVHDDALADVEAVDGVSERCDHAGAVRTEDARLRNRRQALAHPHVEVVQRGCSERHQDLALFRDGVVDVLVAKHVEASVLVYAHGLHEAESSHDRRRAEGAGDGAGHRRDRCCSGRAL